MKRPSTIIIGAPKEIFYGEGMIYSRIKYAERRGRKAFNSKNRGPHRPHLQADRNQEAHCSGAAGGMSAI